MSNVCLGLQPPEWRDRSVKSDRSRLDQYPQLVCELNGGIYRDCSLTEPCKSDQCMGRSYCDYNRFILTVVDYHYVNSNTNVVEELLGRCHRSESIMDNDIINCDVGFRIFNVAIREYVNFVGGL